MKGTLSATSHKTAPAARREIDYSLIIAPAALVICVIFFTIMNPRFISLDNLMNILRQGGPLFIVSFGLVGVILIGSIDISSDGLLSLAGVSAVMLANIVQDGGGWLSVLLGTGIGLVFGVFMGFLVSYVRLPSFLVTYGTSTICRGIALIVSGGIAQNTMFVQFKKLGSGQRRVPADAGDLFGGDPHPHGRPHDQDQVRPVAVRHGQQRARGRAVRPADPQI